MDSQVASCLDDGAIDYISKPFSTMVLRARVRAALRSNAQQPTADKSETQRGATLAFVGAKGGVGVTTLAVNIGARLVQVGRTAIVCEMQPNAIAAAVQLGLNPHQRRDQLLVGDNVQIARGAIEEHLLRHVSGLRLLLGPTGPDCHVPPPPEAVGELVQMMRTMAQYTILDVGNGQSQWAQEYLRHADQIILVLELEPCSLLSAVAQLDRFADSTRPLGSLGAVINYRVNLPSPPIGLNYVREQLNCDILGVIPADPEGCVNSIKQNKPIVLSRPESTMAGALTALANRLTAERARVTR